jgi:hypothetical protein
LGLADRIGVVVAYTPDEAFLEESWSVFFVGTWSDDVVVIVEEVEYRCVPLETTVVPGAGASL